MSILHFQRGTFPGERPDVLCDARRELRRRRSIRAGSTPRVREAERKSETAAAAAVVAKASVESIST